MNVFDEVRMCLLTCSDIVETPKKKYVNTKSNTPLFSFFFYSRKKIKN